MAPAFYDWEAIVKSDSFLPVFKRTLNYSILS